jgi:mxaJ protein
MCSRCRDALLLALLLLAGAAPTEARRVLRVCADPNNLPFSNARGEGFENRLATLIAAELDADVAYTWQAQRRGFIRETLRAGRCDVVLGVPTAFELTATTSPYYRSSYVFVTRRAAPLGDLRSLDDPRLRRLRVGVPLIGDDGANAPPAHALSRRGIIDNVVGYTVYGDYRDDSPPRRLVDAVARGEIDVAIAWGPLAGYVARHAPVPLRLQPVSPQVDLPFLPFVFDIAVGLRRGEDDFRRELDDVLARRRADIDALLRQYGVPRLDRDGEEP